MTGVEKELSKIDRDMTLFVLSSILVLNFIFLLYYFLDYFNI